MEIDNLILTIVTFTPALGGILLLFFNRQNVKAIRAFSLVVALITFILSLHLIAHFDSSRSGFSVFSERPMGSFRRYRLSNGS